jgi:hypothetical protein
MLEAFRKKKPALERNYADVRELYDAKYFDGRSLVTDTVGDGLSLYNLLLQGEVTRLTLVDMLEETRALHATQQEILQEMRLARLAREAH